MSVRDPGEGWVLFKKAYLLVAALWIMVVIAWPVESMGWVVDLDSIEPSQLHRDLKGWTILDARPSKDWQRGCIPGALSFSWEDYIPGSVSGTDYRLPTPERLAAALGSMGITESTPVVIYGDADRSAGGEGWGIWVLSWLGHKGPIRLLDGGIQYWRKQGYPIVSGREPAHAAPSRYELNVQPELNVQAAQLEERGSPWAVIDTRSSMEWMKGHLPNAIHIPWTKFYRDKERRPIGGAELSRLLRENGVDPERPVVFYCAAGVRSAYAWMVYTLSGARTARNYWGGIWDWRGFFAKKASRKDA